MLEKLYGWVWSRVGGRPWTYIIRDEQKKAPLAFLLLFLGLGLLLAKVAGKNWWQLLLGFLVGILVGHLWW